jgi:hypothetical protein
MEGKQKIVTNPGFALQKLRKRIETQDKIILMLNMQLSNARLKNENLERLVTTRNGKTIED